MTGGLPPGGAASVSAPPATGTIFQPLPRALVPVNSRRPTVALVSGISVASPWVSVASETVEPSPPGAVWFFQLRATFQSPPVAAPAQVPSAARAGVARASPRRAMRFFVFIIWICGLAGLAGSEAVLQLPAQAVARHLFTDLAGGRGELGVGRVGDIDEADLVAFAVPAAGERLVAELEPVRADDVGVDQRALKEAGVGERAFLLGQTGGHEAGGEHAAIQD